ncbi:hypothetical protein VTJ49DRAFT_7684 [Mycothermus thermophilus]|uniref:Ribosomal protein/NADH dehydrogenase domain-containing protein n=1 Tax=Humicola insolens TaxID=85995 RepID=A0ABR3VI95_HUMIN
MSGRYAFAKGLKELRFLFCQTGEHSAATRSVHPDDEHLSAARNRVFHMLTIFRHDRSFLTRAYPIMKKNNPTIPIMLREAQGTLPKVYARYEFGKEKSESLEGLSDKQIEDTVTKLVKE